MAWLQVHAQEDGQGDVSVEDQMKVSEEFKTGKPVMDIVQKFRISKSEVYEIRKCKDSIAKYATSSSSKHSKII